MNTHTLRTNSVIFFTLTILLLSGSFFALWASTADEGPLEISDPGNIAEKKTVKVRDPNKADRVFDHTKFTATTDPIGVVQITNPTANDANFVITPLKSGKTKLTIQYVDGNTTLKGTRDLVVPYKSLQVQGMGAGLLKLVSGQSENYDLFGVDITSGTVKINEAEVTSKDPTIVTASFSGQKLRLEAQKIGSTDISVKVLGVDHDPIKVQVTEGITKIEVSNRGVVGSGEFKVVIPESETRQFKIRIVGSNGTEYKRTDVPLETTVGGVDPCGVVVQATYDEKDENLLNITTPALIPTATSACTTAERIVTLKIPKGAMAAADITTNIKITITQKVGFIKLTASSPVLSQNGRITITAEVFNRSNLLVLPPPDVGFTLRTPTKDSVWVGLVKEGNKATLVSRNPSQQEIRDANNGELVTRPSEVVVIATTRLDPQSPEIESRIIITLAEIVGFDLLKVKLNIMDERTAGDLYGKVTSDEYYVLTVRLFNNLKDERTGAFTGNSILAYSSSIEIAVQLEKRFDRSGSNSYFPTVISKEQAKTLVDNRARITAAQQAQQDLNAAIDEQYTSRHDAIKKVNDAMLKRTRAEKLTSIARGLIDLEDRKNAFAVANKAIEEFNIAWVEAEAALEKASAAEDQVMRSRAQLARDSLNRAMDAQVYLTDPDTAIDDGKWHPMSPADLIRLGTTPVPSTTLPRPGVGPLPKLSEAEIGARPRRTTPSGASEEADEEFDEQQDPPCRGVITYRPFTFEMMVNTVDRRDNRSVRSKIFKVLEFIGTGTSFVTAVAVPGPSSDLPLGLEKYGNLLLPGLDKLYPNFKEQQRQNIVSQAMKEIEEIPFGSDITRVVFIPKKNIHGLLRGHDVRISEICPFFFRIQVAIVSKSATVEQGAIRQ